MNEEAQIAQRYEAKLATLDALDRAYYLTKEPTKDERTAYFDRQSERQRLRDCLYAELNPMQAKSPARRPPRRAGPRIIDCA